MEGDKVWFARRKVEVPGTRDESGGHDPVHTFVICGGLVTMPSYQVAAHTTPNP
jgi:hypothetical protein